MTYAWAYIGYQLLFKIGKYLERNLISLQLANLEGSCFVILFRQCRDRQEANAWRVWNEWQQLFYLANINHFVSPVF